MRLDADCEKKMRNTSRTSAAAESLMDAMTAQAGNGVIKSMSGGETFSPDYLLLIHT
jgi:hypothetical protein